MARLDVLHISDLHWSPKSDRDISIVIDALLRDIDRVCPAGKKPDIVIFSGDLVWSGSDIKHFEKAYEASIQKICKKYSIPKERVFMCPGNHDIDRDQIIDFVEDGLKSTLASSEATNKFIDSHNESSAASKTAFARLKNFNVFMRSHVFKPPNITSSQMLQTHRLKVDEIEIGIAVLNSSWRCTGAANDADRNFLLIGERNVDEAIKQIEGCDLKFAVFHHPTDWLHDTDRAAILSRLYSNFDVLLHGHIHQAEPEQRFTTSGSAYLSQAGCLYASRKYANSYQLLSFDMDISKLTINIRTYFDTPRREFDAALNINNTGTFVGEIIDQKKTEIDLAIRKQLREAGLGIRSREADHLDIAGVLTDAKIDTRSTFVCPPLNSRRHAEAGTYDAGAPPKKDRSEYQVELDDILKSSDHAIFISQREGGKTSLANHIAVLVTEGMSDLDRMPVVISYANFLKGRRGIIEEYNTFYKHLPRKIDCLDLLDKGKLLVIVDDVHLKDEKSENELVELLKSFGGNRFILMADSTHLLGDPSREHLSAAARIVYVKSLPRKSIRELSSRWCRITGIDNNETNTFIVKQLRENNLPRTGYIISLLIWAYQKQKKAERINEAFLLSAVIDNLLSKRDYTKALRKEFDPISVEITLKEIASFLRASGGIASVNDTMQYTADFFKRKKLEFNALDVINQLIECGILDKKDNDIQFKYKCFQEYFIAICLRDDHSFRMDTVTNNALEYARELYLLSGLRRQNMDILDSLRGRLDKIKPNNLESFRTDDFSLIARQNVFDPESKKKLTTIKTKKISAEQIDDLLDATEKQLDKSGLSVKPVEETSKVKESDHKEAKNYESTSHNLSDFMTEVSLYGSIIKNSEFDDGNKKDEALVFYVNTMTIFIVFLVDTMSRIIEGFIEERGLKDQKKNLEEREVVAFKNKMLLVMQRILVNIASLKISSDLASEKLGLTFKDYVNNKETSPEKRLFIALLLYDINYSGWVDILKRCIDENDSPFMLDTVTERLWHDLYNRFENEGRRAQITSIVDHISQKHDRSQNKDRTSRQAVDRASTFAQVRGKL